MQAEQQKNEEQEKNERTPPDPELQAIKRIRGILGDLPPLARQRVLAYVADRANEERFSVGGLRAAMVAPSEWEQREMLEAPLALAQTKRPE
jgi:hypothetical protein